MYVNNNKSLIELTLFVLLQQHCGLGMCICVYVSHVMHVWLTVCICAFNQVHGNVCMWMLCMCTCICVCMKSDELIVAL